MSSIRVSVRQQFEAEICGLESKRSINEKVKIVKYFILNREIIFPGKSASIVKCLFSLSEAVGDQENEDPSSFAEVLQMFLVAIDRYPAEFILAENITCMVELIGKFSLISSNNPLICDLICNWFAVTKNMEDLDRFDFCFDILESLDTRSFATNSSLENVTKVLAEIVATFHDLPGIFESGENAQNVLQDEKDILLKILCLLDSPPQLSFLTSDDQRPTEVVKGYYEQLSRILQITLFKDVLRFWKKEEDENPPSSVERLEEMGESSDEESSCVSKRIAETMQIFDDKAGAYSCMFGCWLRELGNISRERVNPESIISDIILAILSEELPIPENDPLYKCKAISNLLFAVHDTHNNENWATVFDPKCLQNHLYKLVLDFNLHKDSLTSTTGESSEKLDLIVSIFLLKGDLVIKSSSIIVLTAAAIDIGHKNFLATSLDYFVNLRRLLRYFSDNFLPTLKVFMITPGNQSSLQDVEKNLIGEVYAKYFSLNTCIDLQLAMDLSLLFLDFWSTNREKSEKNECQKDLNLLVLHFIKVFLERMVDDRREILSPLRKEILQVVGGFQLITADEDVITSLACQKLCNSVNKSLNRVCSKFDLKSGMDLLMQLMGKFEIEDTQRVTEELDYLTCFLQLKSSNTEREEKISGFKKLARKLCKCSTVEQLRQLMTNKSVFGDVDFQNLLFSQLSTRNVDLLGAILSRSVCTKIFNFALMDWNLILDIIPQFDTHKEVFRHMWIRCQNDDACTIEPDFVINIITSLHSVQDDYKIMYDLVRVLFTTSKRDLEVLQNFVLQLARRSYDLFQRGEEKDILASKMLRNFLCLVATGYEHDMKDLFLPKACKLIKKVSKEDDSFQISFESENEPDMFYHIFLCDSDKHILTDLSLGDVFAKFSLNGNANLVNLSFLLHLCNRANNDIKMISFQDISSSENKEDKDVCSVETVVTVLEMLAASEMLRRKIEKVVAVFSLLQTKRVFFHLLLTDILGHAKEKGSSTTGNYRELESENENQHLELLKILINHPKLNESGEFYGEIFIHLVQLSSQMDVSQKIKWINFLLVAARQSSNFINAGYVPFLLRFLDTVYDRTGILPLLDAKTELLCYLFGTKNKLLLNANLTLFLTHIFHTLFVCCSTCRVKKDRKKPKTGPKNFRHKFSREARREVRGKLRERVNGKVPWRSEEGCRKSAKKTRKRDYGQISQSPHKVLNTGLLQCGESLGSKMSNIEVEINDKSVEQLKKIVKRFAFIVNVVGRQSMGKYKIILSNILVCYLMTNRTFIIRWQFVQMFSRIIKSIIYIVESSKFFEYVLTHCTAAEKVILTQFKRG